MPRIVDKEAKRRKLVTAAARVFARDGYGKTRMAAVAEAAGVGKGTLYEYFPSKEDLFLEVCAELIHWPQAKATAARPAKPVARMIDELLASYESSKRFFVILADFWSALQREDPAIRKKFAKRAKSFYDQPRKAIVETLQAGSQDKGADTSQIASPESIAALIIAVIEGVRIQARLDPDDVDPAAVIRLLKTLLDRADIQ